MGDGNPPNRSSRHFQLDFIAEQFTITLYYVFLFTPKAGRSFLEARKILKYGTVDIMKMSDITYILKQRIFHRKNRQLYSCTSAQEANTVGGRCIDILVFFVRGWCRTTSHVAPGTIRQDRRTGSHRRGNRLSIGITPQHFRQAPEPFLVAKFAFPSTGSSRLLKLLLVMKWRINLQLQRSWAGIPKRTPSSLTSALLPEPCLITAALKV